MHFVSESASIAHHKRGFSLVELSIVLVILGLLVGGVLSGQSLIRAAELRSVSTEYNRWVTATQTFRDKYFALPGDMTNAQSFWGTTASCPGTAGTGTQTCNGNGDGIINLGATVSQYNEVFTYWQHLANAGLIEGSYTGIAGPAAGAAAGTDSTTSNVPRSKLSNALWFSWNWNTTYTADPSVFDGTYRDNMLQIGARAATGGAPGTPVLKPEEVWNIDTKMDDGKPAYGIMRERFWGSCTTAASSADYTANYKLDVSTITCTPIFFNK